jgi:hypothetical protein
VPDVTLAIGVRESVLIDVMPSLLGKLPVASVSPLGERHWPANVPGVPTTGVVGAAGIAAAG